MLRLYTHTPCAPAHTPHAPAHTLCPSSHTFLPPPRDRRLVKELVAGVTRWRRRLDYTITACSTTPADKMEPMLLQVGGGPTRVGAGVGPAETGLVTGQGQGQTQLSGSRAFAAERMHPPFRLC
jgi:hypothetical protein